MPTLTDDTPTIGCRIPIWRCYADGREFGIDYATEAEAQAAIASYSSHFPAIAYTSRRKPCMAPIQDHGGTLVSVARHEYASLMVPCTHCTSIIAWSAGEWRDSFGTTTGTGRVVMHKHEPDPRYL